jgi:phosphohistidine phosphatase SixA
MYSGVVKCAAIVPLVLALLAGRPVRAQEAIYIVRHAERADQSADSPLSTAGIGRSYKLRDMLREAGITRIFTSELRRTIDTAAPLAAAIKVTPEQTPSGDAAALAARIGVAGAHDRVLVVGHSNTIPTLLQALHVDATISIGDDEYGNLFIIVPGKDGRPVLLRLKY